MAASVLQGGEAPVYNQPGGHGDLHNRRAVGQELPLPKPKFEFAPEMPEGVERPADFSGTWWIAQVAPRHTCEVVEAYAVRGIAWCIPQTIVTTRYTTNRTRRVRRIPLLPGYLPVCIANDDTSKLRVRDNVKSLLEVRDQQKFIFQLDQLYRANCISPLDPWPFAIEGSQCKIRSGEFVGMVGVVIRRENQSPLVILELGKLGGASIPREFEACDLEPL